MNPRNPFCTIDHSWEGTKQPQNARLAPLFTDVERVRQWDATVEESSRRTIAVVACLVVHQFFCNAIATMIYVSREHERENLSTNASVLAHSIILAKYLPDRRRQFTPLGPNQNRELSTAHLRPTYASSQIPHLWHSMPPQSWCLSKAFF